MRRERLNLDQLPSFKYASIDVEATGLKWFKDDKLFGIAISASNGPDEPIYSTYIDVRDQPRAVKPLTKLLARVGEIANHNIKFDAHMLRKAGVSLPLDRLVCTCVNAALINEHEYSYELEKISTKCLGEGKESDLWPKLAAMFGGKPTRASQITNLHRAPKALTEVYAIQDAELALRLHFWQQKEIANQGIEQVVSLERQLLPVLIDIEAEGVAIDAGRAEESVKEIDLLIDKNQQRLNKLAGKTINANSPVQVKEMFKVRQEDGIWRTESGFKLMNTDSGGASIDADALRMMEEIDPRAKAVLDLRKSTKARSFLTNHILGHQVNGRVYPNYNQTKSDSGLGTGTGRFSINDPALQQIPARDVEIAAIVRPCFVPDSPDHDWLSADWEQFEFRWFAHYTRDPALISTYNKKPESDFHQMVSDMTGLPRSARFAGDPNAKQINLGLVFGMGQGTMAYEMGLPFETHQVRDDDGNVTKEWRTAGPEAIAVFDKYHAAIPGVKALLSSASSIAKSRGYVRTVYGRRLRFPKGQYHKAGGLIFQGSSADAMKYKMIELHALSKKMGFKVRLSVHDEFDSSIPKEGRDEIIAAQKKCLETFDGVECPIQCDVPILSAVQTGPNWWEASK